MEWLLVILLLLLGLISIIAEVIFVPGSTVAGILGAVFSITGVYLSFQYFGDATGSIVMSVAVFIVSIAIYYSFSAKTWDKLALHDTHENSLEAHKDGLKIKVGSCGICKTDLRPVGTGIFDNHFIEVTALQGYIHVGTKIHVVKIEGNKIFVSNLKNEN